MSEYFDQLSLSAVANLSAGLVSTNGGLLDLIVSLVLVRLGLRIFYNTTLQTQREIQLIVVSALSWIIGHALVKGHVWGPSNLFLPPEDYVFPSSDDPKVRFERTLVGSILNFLKNIV